MSFITKPPPGTLLRGDSPLARKLLQFYAMNEGAGKRLVNVAGDNRQGYSLMQDGVTWRGGQSGPCTAYNGSATIGQALMQGTGLYATNGNIFTFGVRFLVTTVAASTQAISGMFANQNPVFECCRAAGNVSVTGFGTIIADTAANTIMANEWNTFVYTRSGTGANSAIYLNGVKMALSTNSATNFSPTAAAMRIGARGDNGTPFIGLVDWLGVWDYALPAQMVSLLTQDTWSLLVPRKTYSIAASGFNGVLSQTLGALTSVATGAVDVQGVVSKTLGAIISSAQGAVDIQGSLSVSLGAATLSSTGTDLNNGSLASTLGALTASATGTVLAQGALTATLGAATVSSAGTVAIGGVVSRTFGALVASAQGKVDVFGVTSKTLGAVTVAADGIVGLSAFGELTKTLGVLTSAATGTVAVQGTLTRTLGTATSSATGSVAIQGALAKTLGAVTASAAGQIAISGVASATLGACTVSSQGSASSFISGTLLVTLGSAVLNATGTVHDLVVGTGYSISLDRRGRSFQVDRRNRDFDIS